MRCVDGCWRLLGCGVALLCAQLEAVVAQGETTFSALPDGGGATVTDVFPVDRGAATMRVRFLDAVGVDWFRDQDWGDLVVAAGVVSLDAGVVSLAQLDVALQAAVGLANTATQPGHTHLVADLSDASANARSFLLAANYTTMRALLNVEDGATADQTGAEIKTAYEANADTNAYTDAAVTKLTGIETAATADQTAAEIETAYNAQVAAASQVEMETGTEAAIRRMSPLRIAQAIAAQASAGGGLGAFVALPADGILAVNTRYVGALTAADSWTLPTGANGDEIHVYFSTSAQWTVTLSSGVVARVRAGTTTATLEFGASVFHAAEFAHDGSAWTVVDSGQETIAGNLFVASPNGTAGLPSFRALSAADVPALPASGITAADVGAYYTGTDVEAILQEIGAGGFGGNLQVTDIDTFVELDTIVADESLLNTSNLQAALNDGGPYDLSVSSLEFEGVTVDAFKTTVNAVDPTTNNAIWLQNAGGTLAFLSDITGGSGISSLVEDTAPQLGGQLDVNGFPISDGTRELLTFIEDASAVNHVNIENEATGSGPILSAAGDDVNIALKVKGKGTGLLHFQSPILASVAAAPTGGIAPSTSALFLDDGNYGQVRTGGVETAGYAGAGYSVGYKTAANAWAGLFEFGGEINNTADPSTREAWIYDSTSATERIHILPTSIKFDGITWPTADGTAGQFLQTNGAGVLSFATGAGGDSVSVDGVAVVDPNFDSAGDVDFVNTTNVVTANIKTGVVTSAKILDGTITTTDISGTAGITDAQVSDTLTASLFVGSGSTTTAVDLATAEVAGVLPLAKVAVIPRELTLALSDLTTSITANAATVVGYWDAPEALTITGVRASALTAPTGSGITIDIHEGTRTADGTGSTTIMATNKIKIDATQFWSPSAAVQPTVTTTAIASGRRLYFYLDAVGSTEGGKGIQATIKYTIP